jgi:hypothetical protein
MRRTVSAYRIQTLVDEVVHTSLDGVADHADFLKRLSGRIANVPVLHHGWHVGAGRAARERDRPIGV